MEGTPSAKTRKRLLTAPADAHLLAYRFFPGAGRTTGRRATRFAAAAGAAPFFERRIVLDRDRGADRAERQAAMEALILVLDLGGPTMFARIGFMQALNRNHVRVFNSDRKDTH